MPLSLTDEDAQKLAANIVAALIHRLSDPETVKIVVGVWGKEVDRWIGKGVRRLALYVFLFSLGTAAVKYQIWNFMLK